MITITFDATWWVVLVFIVDTVIRVTAIIVVPRNRRPTAAMAWLLAIYFIPIIGVFLFLLIGNPRLPRKRRRKQERINDYIHDTSASLDFGTLRPHAPAWFTSLVTLNRNLGAMPLAGDNAAHLIPDYQESLDAMADAIRESERFVHVEFYILQSDAATDNFFRALEEASARGVTVRVLLDHWANRGKPFYKRTLKRLTAMGAQWHLMLPVQPLRGKYQRPDLRNHRKLLVVDGRVAFTGSQNVTDSTYNLRKNIRRGLHWVDLMARIEGPIVASVNAVFLSDWYSETDEVLTDEIDLFDVRSGPGDLDCQIVPSGPGFEFQNNLKLFAGLLYAAQRKIIVVSPYFVPDEAMVYAITSACQRGLEVQLFVSEIGDQFMVWHAQRSYYSALLEAGVRIFLYPAPFILHSKHFSIDDDIAVIGSSNMDIRSFSLNSEVSLMVRGESFVAGMREVEQAYRDAGRELTLEEWRREPGKATFLDGLMRLTSALN